MNVDLHRWNCTPESTYTRFTKKSRQIKTYFNQLEILTMCNNMNNVNSTAVYKYTSFNFNFKLSSYLKEPSYTERWSDKSADEL